MKEKNEIRILKRSDFHDVRLQDHLNGELEILPLRTLDDFLLAKAKFQIPDYKHAGRWWHRVYNNLYYYQSNYFLTGAFIFMCFLFLYASKLIYGLMLTHNIIRLLPWLRSRKSFTVPGLIGVCIAICLLHYFEFSIMYAVSSFMLFWTSIFTIIFVTFVHASLRLRNLCNKVVNFLDGKEKRTPMTVLIYGSVSYVVNNIIAPDVKNTPPEEQVILQKQFYEEY